MISELTDREIRFVSRELAETIGLKNDLSQEPKKKYVLESK